MAKKNFIPAVSVVIPMYNSEKYIGECLQSISEQSFKDFEVIVVDDCSTDKSCEVVEKFIPKFRRGGAEALKLFRSEKNSGNPGTPRNTGIRLSRGEYICFVDSDDAIMKNALEELYRVAEKFNADVVHFGKYYRTEGEAVTTDKKLLKSFSNIGGEPVISEPTPITDDFRERILEFCNGGFWWATWCNFVRRNFILQNNFMFPECPYGGDLVFTFYLVCCAKKIVRVPETYYVYRKRTDSASQTFSMEDTERFCRHIKPMLNYTGIMDRFMDTLDVFKENPDLKYFALEFLSCVYNPILFPFYLKIPPYEFDKFIREELSGVGDLIPLTAFIFNRMNGLNVQLRQQQEINFRLQKELEQFKSRIL